MKHTVITALLLIAASAANAQVSLREYCPNKQFQYKATCASYAPAYIALSTQYNAKDGYKVGDANFHVFSDGFVASKMKAQKSGANRVFNKCGKYVTSETAMNTLKNTGTTTEKVFPHDCDCAKMNKAERSAQLTKIKDWKELGDNTTPAATHIQAIKSSLDNKAPVIISILQVEAFRNATTIDHAFPAYTQEDGKSANHVVTILGYDDNRNGGSFLVRNNYSNWGDKGFAYIPYTDMLKIIKSSYRMTI
jgi:C1A family cysteine protease